MALSFWYLGLCSIRASLEHAAEGIRCIEWLLEQPEPEVLMLDIDPHPA